MSSSDYAIRVQGLSKRYRLGLEQPLGHYRYKSLRDSLGGIAYRPLQTARGLLKREPMNDTNSFWALDDVSFDVKHGEVIGIIGRNGAGKSTLLKILSRITKPTKGQIELHGRVGSLLEVGTGFHPELSGRENIYLNGAILGMTRAEVRRKFDEIVAFSEIERFLDTPVKQYSSGMYTRLAFAVAAHLEPEILVVDEVLAVGDVQFQKKCLGKMKDVADEGRTVLFVSHNLNDIERLCGSVVLMRSGKVESAGEAGPQISRYIRQVAQPQSGELGLQLLPDLSIVKVQPSTHSIRCGESCEINLEVLATADTVIDDLCVNLCVNLNDCIAAVDLRESVIPKRLARGERLQLTVAIESLPLVEREYNIGLFVRSLAGFRSATGLATLEIRPIEKSGAVYSPQARGYFEPSFDVTNAAILPATVAQRRLPNDLLDESC